MDLYHFSELVALVTQLQHMPTSEELYKQYCKTVQMAYAELLDKDKAVANKLCDPLWFEIMAANK